jgi:pyrroloquinoline quinone (PQQ) biosynthesis protein C
MAGEICAQQMIASVATLLAPHLERVDKSGLTWLTHHNEVEGDHAEESLELARFVPQQESAVESVVKGALGVHGALWESLDSLLARVSDAH